MTRFFSRIFLTRLLTKPESLESDMKLHAESMAGAATMGIPRAGEGCHVVGCAGISGCVGAGARRLLVGATVVIVLKVISAIVRGVLHRRGARHVLAKSERKVLRVTVVGRVTEYEVKLIKEGTDAVTEARLSAVSVLDAPSCYGIDTTGAKIPLSVPNCLAEHN
jgi:hypothetical protein